MRRVLIVLLSVLLCLTGCNTVAGAGADAPPPPPPPTSAPTPQPAPQPAPRPLDEPQAHPDPGEVHGAASGVAGAVAGGMFPMILGKKYVVMPVMFATDRKPIMKDGKTTFGPDRGALRYGRSEVSIPRDHRIGALESPKWWKLQFRPDPEKHVVLLRSEVLSPSDFYARVSDMTRQSGQKRAFVFVHGYNVSFEDAARRTGQMAYDLEFDGVPVFYSWPSQAQEAAYTVDETNIEWAEVHLRAFLQDFLARSGADDVYLIAHSMGNRALTRAVSRVLVDQPDARGKIREIILAAPDIDADVFLHDIAPALAAGGRPVTLYASADDVALLLSKQVHGYARAGDAGGGLVITNGVETIDATGLDTGFLGHSYFGENRSVISDIYAIMREGKRAQDRYGLLEQRRGAGRYWVFKP